MQARITELRTQTIALLSNKEFANALPLLEEMYQLDPSLKTTINNLLFSYLELEQWGKSLKVALEAIEYHPGEAYLYEVVGNYYSSKEQDLLALEYFIKANDLYLGKNGNCLYNMAILYKRLEEPRLAAHLLELVLRIDPEKEKVKIQLSFLRMALGEWPEALDNYETRWQEVSDTIGISISEQLPMFKRAKLEMMGDEIKRGDTIFVYPEQGTGDFFHFMRYFKHMQNHGFHINFMERSYTDSAMKQLKPIHRLLHLCIGIDEITLQGNIPRNIKAYAPLMSLPWLCQTSYQAKEGLAQIPPPVPIPVPQDLIDYWRNFFMPSGSDNTKSKALKPSFIGIAYRGNIKADTLENRYLPLDHLLPLLANTLKDQTGTILILQKDVLDRDQVLIDGFCKAHPKVNVIHPITDETDFLDVAAMLPLLDFVVSTDTALVHLAGNQGVCPVFMPLLMPCEWRWLLDREDSPWYPNLTLIRQQNKQPWNEILTRMATKINASLSK